MSFDPVARTREVKAPEYVLMNSQLKYDDIVAHAEKNYSTETTVADGLVAANSCDFAARKG